MRYGRGFTIIELLISIAVVSLLIALFLPAVMEARESSRRMQCLNNLRQIGAALHNYEEQHTRLPPAMIWASGCSRRRATAFSTLEASYKAFISYIA